MDKKKCIDCGTDFAYSWREMDGFIHKWYQCDKCYAEEIRKEQGLPMPDLTQKEYNPTRDLTEDTQPMGFNPLDYMDEVI